MTMFPLSIKRFDILDGRIERQKRRRCMMDASLGKVTK